MARYVPTLVGAALDSGVITSPETTDLLAIQGSSAPNKNLNSLKLSDVINYYGANGMASYAANADYYSVAENSTVNEINLIPVLGSSDEYNRCPSKYIDGMRVRFLATAENTGSVTINIWNPDLNAYLGVKTVYINQFVDTLSGGEILLDQEVELIYSLSNNKFDLINGSSGIGLGFVIMYPLATLDNYLLCNGASLNTTTYARLFSLIGYKYGGSGANFNLPSIPNFSPTTAVIVGSRYAYITRVTNSYGSSDYGAAGLSIEDSIISFSGKNDDGGRYQNGSDSYLTAPTGWTGTIYYDINLTHGQIYVAMNAYSKGTWGGGDSPYNSRTTRYNFYGTIGSYSGSLVLDGTYAYFGIFSFSTTAGLLPNTATLSNIRFVSSSGITYYLVNLSTYSTSVADGGDGATAATPISNALIWYSDQTVYYLMKYR